MTWLAIFSLAAGTFTLKAIGPLLLGDRALPPMASRLAELLPAALLAALVAVNVVGGDRQLVADARLAGLAAAVLAAKLKASFLVVVLAACAATAGGRALA